MEAENIGKKYQITVVEVDYRPDVIFGFDRYHGKTVSYVTPEDGVKHEKYIPSNASMLNELRLH